MSADDRSLCLARELCSVKGLIALARRRRCLEADPEDISDDGGLSSLGAAEHPVWRDASSVTITFNTVRHRDWEFSKTSTFAADGVPSIVAMSVSRRESVQCPTLLTGTALGEECARAEQSGLCRSGAWLALGRRP